MIENRRVFIFNLSVGYDLRHIVHALETRHRSDEASTKQAEPCHFITQCDKSGNSRNAYRNGQGLSPRLHENRPGNARE
jgi:hypothetical protein